MKITRRKILAGAAWSAPIVVASATVPAYAASNEAYFGFFFDGGGGANSYYNTMTLNFGTTTGSSYTLTVPTIVTIDVVGLNKNATDERSQRVAITSSFGSVSRGAYDPATFTTRYTWTMPVGTVVSPLARGSNNILFTFNDGNSKVPGERITNKVVISTVSAGTRMTQPIPLDSSAVGDYNKGATSPDGIY